MVESSRFRATRTTSSRNSLGYGFGTVDILPAAPLGATDQMSPTCAAVPVSQLACFIGNLDVQAPTAAARESMDRVLAYLADRHAVDITPGATTDFVSRGSNRYPPGVEVHTKTVAGHRDMSATTCPGAFAYAMVEDNPSQRARR